MRYFLGIDGGGTNTQAVLLNSDGGTVARTASGPSNYHTVGEAAAEASLREAIHRVLASAGLTLADVTGIGLGMAGVARPGDQARIRAILSHIARFPRVVLTHDAEAALVGGVGRRHGAVLIAGTGAIAYGVNGRGESRRADGWGHLLGDEGSAYWIGRQGLRAVVRAYDGRGPATALEDSLLSQLGLIDASGLVNRVYADGFGVPQVAELAPLVGQAAKVGDVMARGILQAAGRRLSVTLGAVVRGLDLVGEDFEAVLMGGVFRTKSLVWDAVVATLGEIAPRARAIEPRHDAATGAALLAKQTGG